MIAERAEGRNGRRAAIPEPLSPENGARFRRNCCYSLRRDCPRTTTIAPATSANDWLSGNESSGTRLRQNVAQSITSGLELSEAHASRKIVPPSPHLVKGFFTE